MLLSSEGNDVVEQAFSLYEAVYDNRSRTEDSEEAH
jgi:hypothetical protein